MSYSTQPVTKMMRGGTFSKLDMDALAMVRETRGLDPIALEQLTESLRAPESERRETLFWNVWVERRTSSNETFKPEEQLKTGTRYRVVLDLSTLEYGPGSVSGLIGERVRNPIQEALKAGDDEIEFDVLILPDPFFFEAPEQRKVPLKIDLKKLRQAAATEEEGVSPDSGEPVGVFTELRRNPNSGFSFGRAPFTLKTRQKAGNARIALSVWWQGRPIEELVFQRCIATDASASNCRCDGSDGGVEDCDSRNRFQQGLSGVDSLRIGAKDAVPDGALHLIEFEPGSRMVAVFRRADVSGNKSPYISWELDRSQPQLKNFMQETLFSSLSKAVKVRDPKSTEEIRVRGGDLFRLIFAEKGFDNHSPRKEFKSFVQQYIGAPGGTASEKPSLFVRLIPAGDESPLMLPFGLMAVPVSSPGGMVGSGTTEEFLGFHFRIELPLEFQSYEQPQGCVARWVFVMPHKDEIPKNDALWEAIDAARELPEWLQRHKLERAIEAMTQFREWIGAEEQDPPTGLVLLSHHSRNAVWFHEGEELTSVGLTRQFNGPSLAVLNACSTLAGGESDFIRQLNKRGIYSVIATSVPIEGDMAGEFLNCFTSELSTSQAQVGVSMPVSSVYFNTLQCLKDRPTVADADADADADAKFGPRALVYALLGNGNLPLCPPEKNP